MDIIIATANNLINKHSSIYYCIRSILSQDYENVNIIIAENSNFIEMSSFIRKNFGNLVKVVDATANFKNISYARNIGVTNSQSEYVVFMDDDVILSRDNILSKISKKLKRNDFLCGAHRYWVNPGWEQYIRKEYNINYIRAILNSKKFLPKSIDRFKGSLTYHNFTFIGHFGAIRRSVFNSVNGFDENFKEWSYQDTDLMMRLCNEKFCYDLLYSDDIEVIHLSHSVDKSSTRLINQKRFYKKQQKLGIKFHLNHFFGVFNDDSYELFTDLN